MPWSYELWSQGCCIQGFGIQSACGCIRTCAVSCHSKSLTNTLYPKEQCVELGKDQKKMVGLDPLQGSLAFLTPSLRSCMFYNAFNYKDRASPKTITSSPLFLQFLFSINLLICLRGIQRAMIFSCFILCVHVFWLNVWIFSVCTGSTCKNQTLCHWSYQAPRGHWEIKSGPLEEQKVFLTSQTSPQAKALLLLN